MPVDKKGFGIREVMALIVSALLLRMIALPSLQNVDPSRPQIESKISAELGLPAKLGNRQPAIFSGSIADNPAFSHSLFVNAKSWPAGSELKPLVSGIAPDHPSITPVKSKSGKSNSPGSEGGGLSLAEVPIRRLKIVALGSTVAESGLAGMIDFHGALISDGTHARGKGQAFADQFPMPGTDRPHRQTLFLRNRPSMKPWCAGTGPWVMCEHRICRSHGAIERQQDCQGGEQACRCRA